MIEIDLPLSKSIAIRALALRYSLGTDTLLPGVDDAYICRDVEEMKRGLSVLSDMDCDGNVESPPIIHISEGAAPYRFLIALATSSENKWVRIIPGVRLGNRPIRPLIATLKELGADISPLSGGGFEVRGRKLKVGELNIDLSVSSQFESALLVASPLWETRNKKDLFPPVKADSPSSPYRIMSRRMLEIMSANPQVFQTEGDWSAASVFIVAMMFGQPGGPEILFPSLEDPGDSLQGDSAVVELCTQAMGEGALDVDMKETPDLVPALVVGCVLKGIPFRMKGVANLHLKESDRIEALKSNLKALGYILNIVDEDIISWEPTMSVTEPSGRHRILDHEDYSGNISGDCTVIKTYNDHRIAMSFALSELAGLRTVMDKPDSVEKSFPGFRKEFEKIVSAGYTLG